MFQVCFINVKNAKHKKAYKLRNLQAFEKEL